MYKQNSIAIKDIRPGMKNVNVTFIVLEVGNAKVTKEHHEVRNFKVGDPTACINVSIWDEPSKLISPGDIIRLTKGYATTWRHCLTLYGGKFGEVRKIGEFCMVFNEALNMSKPKYPEPLLPAPLGGMVPLEAPLAMQMPVNTKPTTAVSPTEKQGLRARSSGSLKV